MVSDAERLQRTIRRAARRAEAIRAELEGVNPGLSCDEWLHVRARLGTLIADFGGEVSEIDRHVGTTGAQARLLRYLRLRLGETVTKEELSGVAGISEWARRVRELREDHGWAIHSAVTRTGLRVGEYILELDRPDDNLVNSWKLAKRMRRLKTAGGHLPPKVRLLEFLKAIYPRAAEKDQLAYVAGSVANVEHSIASLIADGWDIVDSEGHEPRRTAGFRLTSIARRDSPDH